MVKYAKYLSITGFLIALFCLCACGGGTNVKTDYYRLHPLAQNVNQPQPVADLGGMTLALGPITLPDYITSRPQIVAADGPNKLKLLENARWAEPLDINVTLVLADNLAYLLKLKDIIQYPWRASTTYDLRLEMTVFTLSADHDKAYLRALYRITDVKASKTFEDEINLTEPITGFSAAEIVAAQNRLLDQASVVMAKGIANITNKR